MFHLIFAVCLIAYNSTSIYQYSLPSLDSGQTIQLSNCRGKKILIVNTAGNSRYAGQYLKLEQLHQLYKEKLFIIAVSSNSFGMEVPGLDALSKIREDNGLHYHLTTPVAVTGTNTHPLYRWLTERQENGIMSNDIKEDFNKYLIDEEGALVGAFVAAVDPMSQEMIDAILR